MTLDFPFRRRSVTLVLAALAATALGLRAQDRLQKAPGAASAESAAVPPLPPQARRFKTSDTLSTEAETLVQLLQEADYNRAAIHSSDYAQVIPDYMASLLLDPQHLFFLASDEAEFAKRYGSTVYENVAYVGNIDPAYDIYYAFRARARHRIQWIFSELKGNFDLAKDQTFAPDRTTAPWPATPAEADDLWRRRLKFELIGEMLNKKTLVQAKETLRKRYERLLKNIDETDGPDLAEDYLDCITRLYDPHTVYWSADTYEDFDITMTLKLVGIGAVLGMQDDYCVVEELVPGGPADLGHLLKPKDKLISVAQDGQEPVEVVGMKLSKIVSMIRGDKGTRVHLVVEPADATDPSARLDIVITRDVVKLNSRRARAALFQVPGPGGKTMSLGVITLPAFYGPNSDPDAAGNKASASGDVARLITQLKHAGVDGIVLDLRHNGGGYLNEAVNVAGLFIPPEPVVLVRDSDGDVQIPPDTDPSVAYRGPLAVLVDRFSASASEIVAGALQDYGRAIVVGDSSTHGKGTVQTVLDMKNLSRLLAYSPVKTGAVKITTQKFYLPDGASTQLRGVIPDIVLPSVDDYLPIGESDLPHALIWDRLPVTTFHGHPVSPGLLARLRADSQERQQKLEEFAYLRKDVDWFKTRIAEKRYSLDLDDRRRQQQADDAFRKTMDAERDLLAKADYPYREFYVTPPPPKPPEAKKPAVKKPDASGTGPDDDNDDEFGLTDTDTYGKLDVPLRETFRVLEDAITLGRKHEYWVSDHPPLTVAAAKG